MSTRTALVIELLIAKVLGRAVLRCGLLLGIFHQTKCCAPGKMRSAPL